MMNASVVLVDGLMCVGKTTLLSRIRALVGLDTQLIQEVIIDPIVTETPKHFFRRNDVAKLEAIRSSSSNIVLVDRSFLSTFAYALSFERTQQTVATLYKDLTAHDLDFLFVYLREEAELAFDRAEAQQRLLNGQWSSLHALRQMCSAYDLLYEDITVRYPRCSVISVDSGDYYANQSLLEANLIDRMFRRSQFDH
jgi:thymidylate kinase